MSTNFVKKPFQGEPLQWIQLVKESDRIYRHQIQQQLNLYFLLFHGLKIITEPLLAPAVKFRNDSVNCGYDDSKAYIQAAANQLPLASDDGSESTNTINLVKHNDDTKNSHIAKSTKHNDDNSVENTSHHNKSSIKTKKNTEKKDYDSNSAFPRQNTCKCGTDYIQKFLKCTMCMECYELFNHLKDEVFNRTRNEIEQRNNDVHKRSKINFVVSSFASSNPISVSTDDFPEDEDEVQIDDPGNFDEFVKTQGRMSEAFLDSPVRIKKVDAVKPKKNKKTYNRLTLRQKKVSK